MDFLTVFLLAFAGIAMIAGAGLGIAAYIRLDRLSSSLADLQAEVMQLRNRLDTGAKPSPIPPMPLAPPRQAELAPPSVPPPPRPVPSVPTPAIPAATDVRRGQLRWLEELAGGRLSVLLGGLALALGGVFIVRYSIVQGWLGPGARILLGLLFACGLAAASEYLRRSDVRHGRVAVSGAYVPGALMAAAIITAFASIYASYALYRFISPGFAFVLLALCSITGLAASSMHGPGLAALGLVGSFATPLLIESNHPDAWLLFGYLLLVSFACFFTAQLRRWQWLAITAAIAANAWVVLWLVSGHSSDAWAIAIYLAALTACAVLLLHREALPLAPSQPDKPASQFEALRLSGADWSLLGVLASTALMVVLLSGDNAMLPPSTWGLLATSAILGWSAWCWRSLALAPAIGAISVILSYLVSAHPLDGIWHTDPGAGWTWTASLFAAGYGLGGTSAFLDRRDNVVWPAAATGVPLALFALAYWVTEGFSSSLLYGLIGALLAIAYAVSAEYMNRQPRSTITDWGVGLYAAAAVSALALGLSMVLEKGWLTVAFAAMAPGLALIERARPISVLRWLVGALAALVAVRLLTEPGILGGDPGRTPIFNWLLYAYGIPALAFWYAWRELLTRRDDLPVKIAEGASIAFLAGLIGAEIRHLMTGDVMTTGVASLGEYGLHSMSWLGLAIGLRLRAGADGGRLVPRYAALGFGALGIANMLFTTLLLKNPVFTGDPVGSGAIFNDLFLAYLTPAVLAVVLYRVVKGTRPWWIPALPGTAAAILAFAYLTLEIGRWFEGPIISMTRLSEGELYILSVVWLLFALGLLTTGIRFGNAVLRQAAFAVLVLVTLKVFLIDLAGLTGLLQAGSFIGLGIALIGIGLAYQRFVLRAKPHPPAA